MDNTLYGIFTLVGFVSEISLAALTRSISDTSPTRVKIPYAHAFHEVISIFSIFLVVQQTKYCCSL